MSGNIAYYGGLVTSGLTVDLDAAKKASYPGTGTAWNDISGNGYTGSFTNGPTYSSNGQGCIVFDGTDDYVSVNTLPEQTNSPLSLFTFVYLNSVGGGATRGVWGHSNSANNNCHMEATIASNWRVRLGSVNNSAITPVTTGVWQQIGFVCDGSNVSFYINGSFISTWSGSTGTILGPGGFGHTYGDSNIPIRPLDGRIAQISIYRRVLSANEITQNYNAYKGRFGL